MKRVTMADIAQRLGISTYSVSRALSGKSGVSESTRLRVLETARLLGYEVPDHDTAITRTKRRGGKIILLIPKDEVHDAGFWMEVIGGCEEEARLNDLDLVTRPVSKDAIDLKPKLTWVRGIIVAATASRGAMSPYSQAGLPVVLITYAQPLEPYDSVTTADREGGHAVAHHLIELGHRRLWFVTDSPHKPSHRNRLWGFVDGARQGPLDIDVHECYVSRERPGESFEAELARAAKEETMPTGIFCATDGLALTVIWALNRRGYRVPEDVSVVGCNDATDADRSTPPLTTLRIPKRRIGAQAVALLVEKIVGSDFDAPARRISFVPELVVRDSTAAIH